MTRHLDRTTIALMGQRWAEAHVSPSAKVCDVRPMPGNAGLSFGFDVVVPAGADGSLLSLAPTDGRLALVVRLAPPGVRRSGNTDVLRQIPLLNALRDNDIPVAVVVWSTSDESWFGTDALIQERLDALPLHMTEAGLSVERGDADVAGYVTQAIDALAAIHDVSWSATLSEWAAPQSIDDELAHWETLMRRCDAPDWVEAGVALRQQLAAQQPDGPRIGLRHGDFQTNNVLFDGTGSLRAIVDWELAGIGAQLLDLGWLAMFCDVACWREPYVGQMRVRVPPRVLRSLYEKATGRPTDHFDWYQAFACYQFGAITAFNLRLHRSGKRRDATWEDKVTSVMRLFERGRELVESSR